MSAEVRLQNRWRLGDKGAVYEFNVKLSTAIRGVKITDAELEEETRIAVQVIAAQLRKTFPWIGKVYLTGRSAGWLAVEDKQGGASDTEIKMIGRDVDQAREDFEKSIVEAFGYEKNGRAPSGSNVSALKKMSLARLRRDQDLVARQIEIAHRTRNTKALEELQVREREITEAIMQKEFGHRPNSSSSIKSAIERSRSLGGQTVTVDSFTYEEENELAGLAQTAHERQSGNEYRGPGWSVKLIGDGDMRRNEPNGGKKKKLRYVRKGSVERSTSRGYVWHDGYSLDGNTMPWLTKQEAKQDAKSQGGVAVFVEDDHP